MKSSELPLAAMSCKSARFVLHVIAVTETLTIRLDQPLAQALRDQADQTGLSKGEIARQALENWFSERGRTPTMRRYFGIVEGPSDLSTNKSYRRNWGKKKG
jgi:hypothetical protein